MLCHESGSNVTYFAHFWGMTTSHRDNMMVIKLCVLKFLTKMSTLNFIKLSPKTIFMIQTPCMIGNTCEKDFPKVC